LDHSFETDFFASSQAKDLIARLPPSHLCLSGGEPLLHDGVEELVTEAARHGHVVTFDTNLAVPSERLERLLAKWGGDVVAGFNISHHLEQVPWKALSRRVAIVREAGAPHFVKYIGVPEDLPTITQQVDVVRASGSGVCVTLLYGTWKGKTFPKDYTAEEAVALLDLVTLLTNGIQIFGGLRMRGRPCRAGADCVVLNTNGNGEYTPCCHSGNRTVAFTDTALGGGPIGTRPCDVDVCLGGIYYIMGHNGLMDEVERYSAMCGGNSPPIGAEAALQAIDAMCDKEGVSLVEQDLLAGVRALIEKRNR
jgi:hypothetical protein